MRHFDIPANSAQKMLDRLRVFDEFGNVMKKGDTLTSSLVEIVEFVGETKGLKPIFSNDDFAIFDKPNDLLVHPVHRHTPYTLLDEAKWHFGRHANIVNRIDNETSGLILVSRHKWSEKELKLKFESKEYDKTYYAIVCGKFQHNMLLDKPIGSDKKSKIRVKMACTSDGRDSSTFAEIINSKDNFTLLKLTPHTGRQHQIRVHLADCGFSILGDPIYNADEEFADRYLNKEITKDERIQTTGDSRMWLHSANLSFSYRGINYFFKSNSQDIFEKFASLG